MDKSLLLLHTWNMGHASLESWQSYNWSNGVPATNSKSLSQQFIRIYVRLTVISNDTIRIRNEKKNWWKVKIPHQKHIRHALKLITSCFTHKSDTYQYLNGILSTVYEYCNQMAWKLLSDHVLIALMYRVCLGVYELNFVFDRRLMLIQTAGISS